VEAPPEAVKKRAGRFFFGCAGPTFPDRINVVGIEAFSCRTHVMEEFLVARYLYELRPDGRYVPTVSVQVPTRDGGTETHLITDPEGRTYRDLNRALAMDFYLLNRWKAKHAPGLWVVIESA